MPNQGGTAPALKAGVLGLPGRPTDRRPGNGSAPQDLDTHDLTDAIVAAIESFRLYDHDDIKVTSEGRKIILTGIARSSDEKQIALTVAWSVPGVTGIEDNIVVDGSEFGC